MNKLLLLPLVTLSLSASVHITKLQYEGGISIFGKVGTGTITIKEDLEKQTYFIEAKTSSSGIVKALSANRQYIYRSEGMIENGRYIPKKFEEIMTKKYYYKKTTYLFDYQKQKVLKKISKEEIVTKHYFDAMKFKIMSQKELEKKHEQKYVKLVPNDYLSLFLNFSADKLQVGKLTYVDQKKSTTLKLLNPTTFEVSKENGDKVYSIKIYEKGSKYFQKAVALDIAFYGDAYVKKIFEKSFSTK